MDPGVSPVAVNTLSIDYMPCAAQLSDIEYRAYTARRHIVITASRTLQSNINTLIVLLVSLFFSLHNYAGYYSAFLYFVQIRHSAVCIMYRRYPFPIKYFPRSSYWLYRLKHATNRFDRSCYSLTHTHSLFNNRSVTTNNRELHTRS